MNTNILYNKYDGKNKSLYTMRRNNIGLTKCIMNLSDYVLYGEPLATKNRLSFHMKMYNSLFLLLPRQISYSLYECFFVWICPVLCDVSYLLAPCDFVLFLTYYNIILNIDQILNNDLKSPLFVIETWSIILNCKIQWYTFLVPNNLIAV